MLPWEANLLAAKNLDSDRDPGQVADEGVEPEPSLRSANQPLVSHLDPTLLRPGGRHHRAVGGGERQARLSAQREVQPLEFPLLVGEDFLGFDRRATSGDGATIRLPRRDVPAPGPAVAGVGGGPEPEIRATRPV